MKAELTDEEGQWVFYIEAENEIERCALLFLGTRPLNNFAGVHIEKIPTFFVVQKEISVKKASIGDLAGK